MKDIHGQAIKDYYRGEESPLLLYNSYGEPEEMPVEVFFRDEHDFTYLEHLAISACEGKILDLGAGAGTHSLFLQALGYDVEAVDNSLGCATIMRDQGIKNVIHDNYQNITKKYDTILMLMNGIGIAGKLNNIPELIEKCFNMLEPDGKIIFDSSDITYLYDSETPRPEHYYGEIRYQYEYKGEKSNWFDWVYVDSGKIQEICNRMNLSCEILTKGDDDQYLGCITKTKMAIANV
ncbi:class I SAM-dependent methyltransferase [Reichenbachiella versicolor]|uniref:class I SAM-dependent methyltransferase n=1 Tax=Reichenbachiella versicolor TaxID=1821036 RepID=UPI001C88A239|nr:methyltransferase domain-containing protein [Reichenbachiella versicolor]